MYVCMYVFKFVRMCDACDILVYNGSMYVCVYVLQDWKPEGEDGEGDGDEDDEEDELDDEQLAFLHKQPSFSGGMAATLQLVGVYICMYVCIKTCMYGYVVPHVCHGLLMMLCVRQRT